MHSAQRQEAKLRSYLHAMLGSARLSWPSQVASREHTIEFVNSHRVSDLIAVIRIDM
jgi:hypothetical protein